MKHTNRPAKPQPPTPEQIIKDVEAEYNNAWDILRHSKSQGSRYLAAGHAQCASALLDRYKPDPERNKAMARLMEKITIGAL
jgi:hypothetical protein